MSKRKWNVHTSRPSSLLGHQLCPVKSPSTEKEIHQFQKVAFCLRDFVEWIIYKTGFLTTKSATPNRPRGTSGHRDLNSGHRDLNSFWLLGLFFCLTSRFSNLDWSWPSAFIMPLNVLEQNRHLISADELTRAQDMNNHIPSFMDVTKDNENIDKWCFHNNGSFKRSSVRDLFICHQLDTLS